MAKLISLKCPDCGANLDVEEGRKQCFCQYCGRKIMIDDESVHTYHTYREVDEARIKEAEIKEQYQLKEMELKKSKYEMEKTAMITRLVAFLALALIATVFCILSSASYDFRDLGSIGAVIFLALPVVLIFMFWFDVRRKK